jgi:hypothetical protein
MSIKTSRDYEHEGSQDGGLARASSRAKTSSRECPIHPNIAGRTTTSLGAPPTGAPPDASSPLPTDPERQHGSKSVLIPAVSWGMSGHHDPNRAFAVMGEATRSPDDHTRLGKSALPSSVKED